MKTPRFLELRLAVPLAFCVAALAASAQQAPPAVATAEDETATLWFVELPTAPTAEGGSLDTVRRDKDTFRKNAKAAGLKLRERYAFDVLWNGLSVSIARAQVGKLAGITGVKAIYPVDTLWLPPVQEVSSPDLATAIAMTGADVAQNVLGLTGAGVKVGVIDSGIDYDHPAFGGDGVPGDGVSADPNFGPTGASRVKDGWDFVGDAFDSSGAGAATTPNPDPYPDSCRTPTANDAGGHGTHVAGIVGADGAVKGVAPNVTLGAYRVFGCVGTTSADVMIAAMERAYADGMQVINMSIGSARQWPLYPTATAGKNLVDRGVVVVASIGNDGAAQGAFSAGAPAVGTKVIGVASYDNLAYNYPSFTISPDDHEVLYSLGTAVPPPPVAGTFPMARTGTQTSTSDACAPLPAGSLTGKVALIRRGTCGFYNKAFYAQAAGAVAVVIYNNVAGVITPNVAGTPAVTIPVVGTSNIEGNLIDTRLAVGPVDLTWTSGSVDVALGAAGLISSYSSYGLTPDLDVKPDLGAPGGYIRSTLPIEYGSYGTYSGTSMASPHVAGAVALLLEALPNTPANAVGTIFQNSADPRLWSGNPGLVLYDMVQRQGAGMLNIFHSILATTRIEPAKLALGESEGGPVTRTLTLENKAFGDVTYDLAFEDAVSSRGTYPGELAFFHAASTVTFSQLGVPVTSITVPAGSATSLDVTILPAGTLYDRTVYGGYIFFLPRGGSATYHVPYAGFKGDYQGIQVLAPTSNNFPWLAKVVGGAYVNQPGGATFALGGDDPHLLAHVHHPARRVRFEVFGIDGKAWGRAMPDLEYFARNSLATSYYAFGWDGTTVRASGKGQKVAPVPDGAYIVKMSVLKALGDQANPAHWESWTSPVITLARP